MTILYLFLHWNHTILHVKFQVILSTYDDDMAFLWYNTICIYTGFALCKLYIVHCVLCTQHFWVCHHHHTLLSLQERNMGGNQDLHVRFAMIALYLFMLEMNYMLIRSARRAIGARVLWVLCFTFPWCLSICESNILTSHCSSAPIVWNYST